jgi:hypothetical protein
MQLKLWKVSLKLLTATLLASVALASTAQASDPVGLYGIIDRVVLEPSDEKPERVQLWGSFSLSEGRGNTYAAPVAGYLYYTLNPQKPDAARKEWTDLKALAGKVEVIGFASRWEEKGKVRKADEKPTLPDVYPVAFGLQKMRRPDYEPVKKLLAFHKEQQSKKVSELPTGKAVASFELTPEEMQRLLSCSVAFPTPSSASR